MQGLSNYKAGLLLGIYCYCVTTALPLFVLSNTISFPIPVMPCTKGQEMNVGGGGRGHRTRRGHKIPEYRGYFDERWAVGKIQLLSLRFGV